MPGAAESIPVPDPSIRTEERLLREIANAQALFKADLRRIEEVYGEKSSGVERELKNLAERTAEQKTDVKEAVNSALSAAKELVALQNTNTLEALRALGTLIQTQGNANTAIMSDLKDRVLRIEAGKVGGTEAIIQQRTVATDQRAVVAALIGVGLFVLTVAGFVIAIVNNKPGG